MVVKCLLCPNRYHHPPYVRFHTFPKDVENFNKWAVICRRPDLIGSFKRPRLCSDHFDESSLSPTNRVRPDTVPSIFSWSMTNNECTDLRAQDDVTSTETGFKLPRLCSDHSDEPSPSAKKRVHHDTVPFTFSWSMENNVYTDLGAEEEVTTSESTIFDEDSSYPLSPISNIPSTPSSWSDNDSNPQTKIIKINQSSQTIHSQSHLDQIRIKT